MFTTPPATGFVEIAAIDVKPGGYGTNMYTDAGGFKDKIRPYVCQAGGDAAIAYANGYGMYIKATVLKAVASPQPEPNALAAVDPSQPPPPSAEAGCHFDTQCKGDRICVNGGCVAPTGAPTPAAATPP